MLLDQTEKSQTTKSNKAGENTSRLEPQGTSATHPLQEEIGGFSGPEPTRYGDWEKNGRCVDF
jgi:hypothetical protein